MSRVAFARRLRRGLLGVSAVVAVLPCALAADSGLLSGRVLDSATPVAGVRVFAYQVAEKVVREVRTDGAGEFGFDALPAGLYKLIAHKVGFAPAVLLVERAYAAVSQTVELHLSRPDELASDLEGDFWRLRAEVPPDVLRRLELGSEPILAVVTSESTSAPAFMTEMVATTGVSQFVDAESAQLAGGEVGLRGRLGELDLVVRGNYQQLGSLAGGEIAGLDGEASSLAVRLGSARAGRLQLDTASHRLLGAGESGLGVPEAVDYEQVRVAWNMPVGEHASTTVTARYVDESSFYSQGWTDPAIIPQSSRSLHVEGAYARRWSDAATLTAGMRYRERAGDWSAASPQSIARLDDDGQQFVDLYGRGEWQVVPAYWIQYGLYTTLRDGSISLMPRGGLLARFGENWEAAAEASRRMSVSGEDLAWTDFEPALFGRELGCDDAELSCYRVQLLRGSDEANQLRIGGSYREYDRPVRLFFSENFFDHGRSLFLVPGDRVPELSASISRRVGTGVVARLETSYGDGGGGSFRAINKQPYANEVSFLTTAFDTRFERSATGVYVAFHRLTQRLEAVQPVTPRKRRPVTPSTASEFERFELVLSQNLSALFDFGSDWAVRVGMEVSRQDDDSSAETEPELEHRLTTGVAVRF